MPSSRPKLREPESEATARASEQVIYEEIWRQSLEVRRAEHEAAAVVRQLQNSMKKSQVMRMANYHWLIAFDNAFREGCGFGLQMFVPSRRVGLLQPNERRFLAPVHCVMTNEIRNRSFIMNKDTREKRIEVMNKSDGKNRRVPTLHQIVDCGSLGLAAANFLVHGPPRLRGTLCFDIFHRVQSSWSDGVVRSGMIILKLELAAYGRFKMQPYNKDGVHDQLQPMAADFFERCAPNALIWQIFYPRICRCRRLMNDPRYGSDEHIHEVFEMTKANLTGGGRGCNVRTGRWWNVEQRAAEDLPKRAEVLMLGIETGLRKGWWPTLEASPAFREVIPDPPAAASDALPAAAGEDHKEEGEGDDPEGAAEGAVSMAAARKEVADRRQKSEGTIRYILRLISRGVNMRMWDVLELTSRPLREAFGAMEVAFTTVDGVAESMDTLCSTWFPDVVASMLSAWGSGSYAENLGFSASMEVEPSPGDGKVLLASWRLTLETVGSLMYIYWHYQQAPWLFLKLCKRETQDATLQRLKSVWEYAHILKKIQRITLSPAST